MTNAVCKLKWNWSTITLQDNTTSSCWKSAKNELSVIHFADFHNSKEKQLQRQMMLDGAFPSGCHWCSDFEKVGATSDRMVHNDAMGGVDDIIHANSTVGKMRTFEVYFSNTCNFSCIYCEPKLSNSINKEIVKFGPNITKSINIQPFTHDAQLYSNQLGRLWSWLEDNITTIEEFNILGGEPLLMAETNQILELINQHPAPNLDLTVVSNLGVHNKVLQKFLNLSESLIVQGKVKSIKVLASIDGWGKEIEFQRYGLDLVEFEQNINSILDAPNVQLGINLTITCLGINSLPALIEKWLVWRTKKPIHLSGSRMEHLDKYYCLGIEVLPLKLSEAAFERAISLMPSDIKSDQSSKDRMVGIFDFMKSKNHNGDSKLIGELGDYLNALSNRRGINWEDYFPWLVETINRNKEIQ